MKNSFIIDNIRKALLRQLVFPLLLLIAALAVYIKYPKDNFLNPRPLNSKSRYENFYNKNLPHVAVDRPKLYYSGFDYVVNGRVCGHYYYSLIDGYCQFYVLGRESVSLENAAPGLESASFDSTDAAPSLEDAASGSRDTVLRGRLVELDPAEYETLMKAMAPEMGWSADSLREISSPYAVSTLPEPYYLNLLFYLLLYGCLLVSGVDLLSSLAYLIWPASSPAFRYLRTFGEVRTLLPKVEMEIRHGTMAQAGSICLTPNYIVNLDTERTLILPLQSVVWIYCHSGLRRFPGLKMKLNYTLHIVARDGRTYDFANQKNKELESILTIIRERRPEILAGYTEENKAGARLAIRRPLKNRRSG